jgi:tetrapyrrole methylase family protein/MazG family protein
MSFEKVIEVVAQLRDPESGCPWDLQQTHSSLVKYLLEESNEVVEVLDSIDITKDFDSLKDELGDVLLQVLLHSQLASEAGKFNFEDVVENLIEKLIRRHPHVFGDSDASTIEEVEAQWKKIKEEELNGKN